MVVSTKRCIVLLLAALYTHSADALEWEFSSVSKPSLGSNRRMLQGEGEVGIASINTAELINELTQSSLKYSEESVIPGLTRSAPPPTSVSLPLASGQVETFHLIRDNLVLAPALAKKFPNLITFEGRSVDQAINVVGTFSMENGMHLQYHDGEHVSYVDPVVETGFDSEEITTDFHVYYSGESKAPPFKCATEDLIQKGVSSVGEISSKLRRHLQVECDAEKVGDMICHPEYNVPECGYDGGDCCGGAYGEHCASENEEDCVCLDSKANEMEFRLYRIAVATTTLYTDFHGGDETDVLAAVTTAMARVNGIFKRDATIALQLIDGNEALFDRGNFLNEGSGVLSQNKDWIESKGISLADYDIGHVFSTSTGGQVGEIGNVCQDSNKAEGFTGQPSPVNDQFTVDFVAHEVGHQFNGYHTMAGCGRNYGNRGRVEPGGGSTIMAYAGICGGDNYAEHSDPHFHSHSFEEFRRFVKNPLTGGSCGRVIKTGIQRPVVDPSLSYTGTSTSASDTTPKAPVTTCAIPLRTPFRLYAVNVDYTDASLAYSWEHSDTAINAQGSSLSNLQFEQSILFTPGSPKVGETLRFFPDLLTTASGRTDLANRLPTLEREIEFAMTVRNGYDVDGDAVDDYLTNVAYGASYVGEPIHVNVEGDSTATLPLQVVALGQPIELNQAFKVRWTGGIKNDQARVRILASLDGGATFSLLLKDSVLLADGEAQVVLEGTEETLCQVNDFTRVRIMVESLNVDSPGCSYYSISRKDEWITVCGELPSEAPTASPTSLTQTIYLTATSETEAITPGYPNNAKFRWVIDNEGDAEFLKLLFTTYNVEDGYDYIHVFNGEKEYLEEYGVQFGDIPSVAQLDGYRGTLNGQGGNATFASANETMTVFFYSDGSETRDGFVMEYSTTDEAYIPVITRSPTLSPTATPPPIPNSPVEYVSVTAEETEYVSHPGGSYANNARRRWVFQAEDNEDFVKLEFSKADVESGYDILLVFSGEEEDLERDYGFDYSAGGWEAQASSIPNFVDFIDPFVNSSLVLHSTNSNVTIFLYTDGSVTRSGFELTHSAVSEVIETIPVPVQPIAPVTRMMDFEESDIVQANLENLEEHVLLVGAVDEDAPIRLVFDRFLMNDGEWVEVSDGEGVVLATLYGKFVPTEMLIDTNILRVEYKLLAGADVVTGPSTAGASVRVFNASEDSDTWVIVIAIVGGVAAVACSGGLVMKYLNLSKEKRLEEAEGDMESPTNELVAENPTWE